MGLEELIHVHLGINEGHSVSPRLALSRDRSDQLNTCILRPLVGGKTGQEIPHILKENSCDFVFVEFRQRLHQINGRPTTRVRVRVLEVFPNVVVRVVDKELNVHVPELNIGENQLFANLHQSFFFGKRRLTPSSVGGRGQEPNA